MTIISSAWRHLDRGDLAFIGTLSRIFARAEALDPYALPNLRAADCLFIGSDYGGEHKGAVYHTIAFLVADIADCAAWQGVRERVRRDHLVGPRRIAFKSMNDAVRKRAFDQFLESADLIPGLVAVFAIHKRSGSLFGLGNKLDLKTPELELLRTLSPAIAEKLLRVVSLLGLLIAGFSAPGQDVLWATDEDAIAANPSRVQLLVDSLARVSSHLLDHDLRQLRVATAAQDRGDLSLEDLLAIPDIAAGGLSNVLSIMFKQGAPVRGLDLLCPSTVSSNGRRALDWFSNNTQPLKRMCVIIDQTPDTQRIRATQIRLHGSRDFFSLSL